MDPIVKNNLNQPGGQPTPTTPTPTPAPTTPAPTPSAPQPAAMPPIQPAAAPNLTSFETETPATQPMQTMQPAAPKKSHKKAITISAIVVAVLLVIGAGLFWFFGFYNNPNKVLADALTKFVSADNVRTSGQFINSETTTFGEDTSITQNIAYFTAESLKWPNSLNLQIIPNAPQDTIETTSPSIELNLVAADDGTLFFRTDGLTTGGDKTVAEIDQTGAIASIAETINNEWWQISIPEITSALGLDEEAANAYNNLYTCAVNTGKSNPMSDIGNIYAQNNFLTATKVDGIDGIQPTKGNSYYSIAIDNTILANFINQLPNASAAQSFMSCYNEALGAELSAEDVDEVSAEDLSINSATKIYFEISNWGHQLNGVTISQNTTQNEDLTYGIEDGYDSETIIQSSTAVSNTITLQFLYEPAQISTPEEYRSVTELVSMIMSELQSWTPGIDANTSTEETSITTEL